MHSCNLSFTCEAKVTNEDIIIYQNMAKELIHDYQNDVVLALKQELVGNRYLNEQLSKLSIQPILIKKNTTQRSVTFLLEKKTSWDLEIHSLELLYEIDGFNKTDNKDKQWRINCQQRITDNLSVRSSTMIN